MVVLLQDFLFLYPLEFYSRTISVPEHFKKCFDTYDGTEKSFDDTS